MKEISHVYKKIGRRNGQPTPVFLSRESRGRRSLVGCCPWGHTESDMTEATWHACIGEGKWQPTPVFLPGESQGRRSLVGCRLWGHTESDTTEVTQQQQQQQCIRATKSIREYMFCFIPNSDFKVFFNIPLNLFSP